MNPVTLVRNLRTGHHKNNTRIWIEAVALETAGFKPGDGIVQTVTKDAIILSRSEEKIRIVNKRKDRPLFESCSQEVSAVIRARERIDLLISDGQIVIRHERSFDLFVIEKPRLAGPDLKKLRLYSAPCGGGMATAALVDTGLYEPVGAVDFWPTAIEAYLNNFNRGSAYLGDLTRKNPEYVPRADVCWLSPSCTEYSGIGGRAGGVTEGHGPHYARLVLATGAQVLMIEQVPSYFKSRSYQHLKMLLAPFFPVFHERVMDAYDFGSVASRTRGYAVAFRDNAMEFSWPQLPKIPEHRRKTVGQLIGKGWERGEWRSIEGSVMYGLLHKKGNNNFKANKNHTLVDLKSSKISAIVASYRKYQVTSSYLQRGDQWRPFRSDELAAFLNVPEFYEFPEWMEEGNRVKLLGQSVDCDVVKSIGIEVGVSIMSSRYKDLANNFVKDSLSIVEEDGQGAFAF
ncbi:hypothetical protein A8L34_28055 [Bacillus sp. FJAT-27264]|uniref:DNA cytosine methyltransferase n=1 Tax=Paenibacillus sp. (strain DSM 101736 / FJAT-27264) TaxID=1850362 RepID=UPI000807AE22|nr:DNA cytosine methyltransferase [Bacillus sp. FJAT-27264]OBZ15903.1 hypothetical protein A8L34_28055 [Bacillus sp. FJAT-27264]